MNAMIQKLRGIKARGMFGALWFVIIGITIIAFWVVFYIFFLSDSSTPDFSGIETESEAPFSKAGCNIAGIDLHGDLYTYNGITDSSAPLSASSEDIIFIINIAEDAENIKAIVLDIDSYGGLPVAAEEVSNALKRAKKPTVALIRESGDSAAYWAATGADIIFASALSDVGSIGVTGSYVENTRYNELEGYDFVSLSIGKFKDTGDPNRKLTDEEKELFMRDIKKINEVFIKTVAENRNLSVSAVRLLADGSSMLGDSALEKGLIDRIGSYKEVREYLKEKIGSEPNICW